MCVVGIGMAHCFFVDHSGKEHVELSRAVEVFSAWGERNGGSWISNTFDLSPIRV